jgi:hypothetical protein
MVDIYKSPHTKSLENMATCSTTSRLDQLGKNVTILTEQLGGIQHFVTSWDNKFDQKLDEKLDKLTTFMMEQLAPMKYYGMPEVEQWNAQHIQPHQEETSHLGLFNHSQPSLGPHKNRSMDNNIWHSSLKVDLNKFDGSDSSG